jgi:cation diffusion facilitator CzcD-associated flavoprotein CzcO
LGYSPTWCKRPCFHDDYLPTFNRPNVHLIDTNGKGVDYLTETGAVVGGEEFPLDLIVFSTGFKTPSVGASGSPAYRAGMEVTGRNGLSLDQKWIDGVGTLHGVISRGFPNLFWPGPFQVGASANWTSVLNQLSIHIAYMISSSAQAGEKVIIEPSEEGEEAWAMEILKRAAGFAALAGCTPSYLNAEGEGDHLQSMEEQMKAARSAPWGQGVLDFGRVIKEWREEGGLKGLKIAVV